jgi:HD-like signal output (HDOD) protein
MELAALNPTVVKACLGRRQSLPTIPTTFSRLMGVVNNPNLNLVDLAEVITCDPVLMATVLKVANSSYTALREPVEDLSEAILYLGTEEIKRIAVSVGSFDLFRVKGASGDFLKNIWLHSLATGFISQRLAKEGQFEFTDHAYVTGLLHDLGKLFFSTFFSSNYAPLRAEVAQGNGDGLGLEAQVFGMTHLDAAIDLCAHWKLPESISIVAAHHHDPAKAPEASRLLTTCVAAANILAHKALADEVVEARLPQLQAWLDELKAVSTAPAIFESEKLEVMIKNEAERSKRFEEVK